MGCAADAKTWYHKPGMPPYPHFDTSLSDAATSLASALVEGKVRFAACGLSLVAPAALWCQMLSIDPLCLSVCLSVWPVTVFPSTE